MYQRPRIMSSSLPPRQKNFDNTNEKHLIHHKQFKDIPPKFNRPTYNEKPYTHIEKSSTYNEKSPAQYELIVQFQLKRQKQKTAILQQRLRNKQSFIKQMKEFQDQLTLAFQKCQQQLLYYKKQCQNYQSKFQSFNTFNNQNSLQQMEIQQEQSNNLIRQYLQQIAELKHLVIRQQEQISFYQQKQKQKSKNYIYSSSAKKEFYPYEDKKCNQNYSIKQNQQEQNRTLRSSMKKGINQDNISQFNFGKNNYEKQNQNKKNGKNSLPSHKQRSKTLANQFVNQKSQLNFNNLSQIEACIHKQTHKIVSFINHFLTMTQFFLPSLSEQNSVKGKLKKAWKWIKNVVVEWNHLKNQNLQKIKEYKVGNKVMQYLSPSLSTQQIESIVEKAFKNKSSSR